MSGAGGNGEDRPPAESKAPETLCFELLGAVILALGMEFGDDTIRHVMAGWADVAIDDRKWKTFKALINIRRGAV